MSPGDWADRQLRNPEACSISQHENGTRPAEGEKGYGNQKLKNRPENGELLRPAISGKAEDERLQENQHLVHYVNKPIPCLMEYRIQAVH
jgi:hypothetical protein